MVSNNNRKCNIPPIYRTDAKNKRSLYLVHLCSLWFGSRVCGVELVEDYFQVLQTSHKT